jgi:hypothetical protein
VKDLALAEDVQRCVCGHVRWSDGTLGLAVELEDSDWTAVDWHFVLKARHAALSLYIESRCHGLLPVDADRLRPECIQQCLRLLHIRRIEAFGAAVIHRGEQLVGCLALPLTLPEAGEAGGCVTRGSASASMLSPVPTCPHFPYTSARRHRKSDVEAYAPVPCHAIKPRRICVIPASCCPCAPGAQPRILVR